VKRWPLAVVLMAVLCAGASRDVSPPVLPAMGCRISVPKDMRHALGRMWARSPTFRQQCERLREADVTVVVRFAHPGELAPGAALTVFYHTGSRLTVARTQIARGSDVVLTLGHELEHVMEGLDHVDFLTDGRRGVTAHMVGRSVETARAIAMGKRIRLEVLNWKR
jgi:hypothetical protein